MFQDISKAFDSISMTGLKIALQRLSLPNRLIDLVIRIFTNRNAQILTAFGPTPSFIAGDGVDQGDSLSPLIWRFYYDPLIKALTTRGTPKPKP